MSTNRKYENNKKVILVIKEISWIIIKNEYINENNTKFRITVDFEINNIGEELSLYYSETTNFYLPNFNFRQAKTFQEITVNGRFLGFQSGSFNLVIKHGISNGTSIMYWEINNQKHETLPDGVYQFWIDLWEYGELYINSIMYRLVLRDGKQIFNKNINFL
ncbi:MAG: hypothetical protein ACTSO7_16565 [Candidatus Heimdallarchaeota archaeon]